MAPFLIGFMRRILKDQPQFVTVNEASIYMPSSVTHHGKDWASWQMTLPDLLTAPGRQPLCHTPAKKWGLRRG